MCDTNEEFKREFKEFEKGESSSFGDKNDTDMTKCEFLDNWVGDGRPWEGRDCVFDEEDLDTSTDKPTSQNKSEIP